MAWQSLSISWQRILWLGGLQEMEGRKEYKSTTTRIHGIKQGKEDGGRDQGTRSTKTRQTSRTGEDGGKARQPLKADAQKHGML